MHCNIAKDPLLPQFNLLTNSFHRISLTIFTILLQIVGNKARDYEEYVESALIKTKEEEEEEYKSHSRNSSRGRGYGGFCSQIHLHSIVRL